MHIGIAGAGLAGRLIAWQLLRSGHSVELFDRDRGDGQQAAGFIAAAMLAPASEAVHSGAHIYQTGLDALERWPLWLQQLHADSGIEVDYSAEGSLVVAHSADSADLNWFYQRLCAMDEIPATHRRLIEQAELSSLEPQLTAFDRAIRLPHEACLDNRALFRALYRAITQLGGQWHCQQDVVHTAPGRIQTRQSRISDFDLVIDCRGFGGKPQLNNFRGVRGELFWLRAPEVKLSRPVRLMHPRYQLYIAPKPNDVYVIGATEIESESLAPVSVRSGLELLSGLYSLHSGFAEAEILESRSHCRPAFLDNLPKIIQQPGLMQVNGLYRHGYLLAPALVDSTLALLGNRPALSPVQVENIDETPLKTDLEAQP